MNTQDEGIRKAAILVAGLDRTTADTLLEQMDVRLAQTVRDCILSMDDVDPAEERLVIEEFLRASPSNAQTTPPEVEIQCPAAVKSFTDGNEIVAAQDLISACLRAT